MSVKSFPGMSVARLMAMLCLPLTAVSCMPGQRLLTVRIEVDGEVLYQGSRGVPDSTPVPEMWNALGDVRFKPAAEAAAGDTHVLEGAVVVRILHSSNELTNASVGKLTLNHDTEAGAWRLDPAEVEQVRAAAKK